MPKNPFGSPPKYATPEALDRNCRAYIELCSEQNAFPDEAGMLLFLKLPPATKARYEKNESGQYAGFAEVFKKYELLRESYLTRGMLADPKLAGACSFLLKQRKNGGYAEKQADGGDAPQIRVLIGGLDAK